MWTVARELWASSADLFASRRDRGLVFGLVLIASSISVVELASAQLFSSLIIPGDRGRGELIVLGVLFFVVYGSLRLISYGQSVYRIKVFETAFEKGAPQTRLRDSWRWAEAMELVAVLTMLARLVVIAAALLLFSWQFALANVVMLLAMGEVWRRKIAAQYVIQRDFRAQQVAHSPASNATKVRARIQAGESAALAGGVGVMGLIGVLVVLNVSGSIAADTTIILFLAVRMTGGMYRTISASLMRYVRARVSAE